MIQKFDNFCWRYPIFPAIALATFVAAWFGSSFMSWVAMFVCIATAVLQDFAYRRIARRNREEQTS